MAGIYIHIPFCKQACTYCNFHFAISLHYKNELVLALLKEIELQKNYLEAEPIETIYFGGGTPSLCSGDELKTILDKIREHFKIADDPEITLEANPDDIQTSSLQNWKAIGINRLSIGVQSFFEEDLLWMNRAHNEFEAKQCLAEALAFFKNITIDLIYGYPLLTNEKWKANVDYAIASGVPHVSAYALTVEPKTPLDKLINKKLSENINPDKQSEQFLLLMSWMQKAGFEHYEISSFARPGWKSRHNSSYWQGKKYLGIGPSAHSFDGISRQSNIANNQAYITLLNDNKLPFEKEELTATQKLNEYIMTSLRTMEGMDLNRAGESLLQKSKKYIDAGLMQHTGHSLVLTTEGKLLADGIAADLFY